MNLVDFLRDNVSRFQAVQAEKEKEKKLILEEKRRKDEESSKKKADRLLSALSTKALAASETGLWFTSVCKINASDKHHDRTSLFTAEPGQDPVIADRWYPWDDPKLKGWLHSTWHGIIDMGLVPYIQYEHSGDGCTSWYCLYATWKSVNDIQAELIDK